MRQRNGADVFGANDPRSASIGIIDVAPEDDRQSVLTAILTQDKLNRKQTVLVLPEQSSAFRRATDFKEIEDALQGLQTQLVFIAQKNAPVTKLVRQRNYQVFASLENYAQYAQTFLNETLTTPAVKPEPARIPPVPPEISPASPPQPASPPPIPSIENEPTRPLTPSPAKRPVEKASPTESTKTNTKGNDKQGEKATSKAAEKPNSKPPTNKSTGKSESKATETAEESTDTEPRDRQKTKKVSIEPTPIILGDPVEPELEPEPPAHPQEITRPAQSTAQAQNTPLARPAVTQPAASNAVTDRPTQPTPIQTSLTQPAPKGVPTRPATPPIVSSPTQSTAARNGEPTLPPVPQSTIPIATTKQPGILQRRRGCLLATIIAILLLILTGGIIAGSWSGIFPLARVFPGLAGATVTITPDSQPFSMQYNLTATLLPPANSGQVPLRYAASTEQQNSTVKTTGVGKTDATYASGTLTFYNWLPTEYTVPENTVVTDKNGKQVITTQTVIIPAAAEPINDSTQINGNGRFLEGKVTVSARALQSGEEGVILANTFNRTPCCANGIFVSNPSAFSANQKARTYNYVLQSDIDQAVGSIRGSLETTRRQVLTDSIQPHERLLDKITCTTHTSSTSQAGEEANEITVTVTVTCSGAVYNLQETQNIASRKLKEDGDKKFKENYAAREINTQVVRVSTEKTGEAGLNVQSSANWVYQFPENKRAEMIAKIAGKKKGEAQSILQREMGVKRVAIDLSFFSGDTLPTNVQQIKLVIL